MAGSVNKVILVGNLGADPEIRRSHAGDPIANLRIATSETWRDKTTGERKERTEWHPVVIFNEAIAKTAEQYLKKGAKVYIEGSLQTRKWEKDGIERYTTEVVLQKFRGDLQMLDKLPSNRPPAADDPESYGQVRSRQSGDFGRGSDGGDDYQRQAEDRTRAAQRGRSRDLDDEIPF